MFHTEKALCSYIWRYQHSLQQRLQIHSKTQTQCLFRKRVCPFLKFTLYLFLKEIKCFWVTAIASLPKSPAQQIKRKTVQMQQCVVPPREILGMHQMSPTFSVWVCWDFKEISSQGEIGVSVSSYVPHSECAKQDKFPSFREPAQEEVKVFRKTSLHIAFTTQLSGRLTATNARATVPSMSSTAERLQSGKNKVMQETSHCSSQHSGNSSAGSHSFIGLIN